jgi:hypothetical protein
MLITQSNFFYYLQYDPICKSQEKISNRVYSSIPAPLKLVT